MAPLTNHINEEESTKRLIVRIVSSERASCRRLAKVAVCSFDDLYSAKLTCKNFNKRAQDSQIFKQVDISKMSLVSWRVRKKLPRLLEHCRDCGNVRDLYRQGVRDLFTGKRIELEIESLKRTASKGHIARKDVGVLRGDSMQKDLELLRVERNPIQRGNVP